MAAKFLVPGGNGNFDSTTNWSATSGGSSGVTAPVLGDTVTIDSNSANANLTINVSSTCTSFVVTGTYTGTLAINNSFTVSGTFTLLSGMTVTASSITNFLFLGSTCSVTCAGITWPCSIRFGTGSAITVTLVDNWVLSGGVQVNGNNNITQTVNGNQLTIGTNLQIGISFTNTLAGTTNIVMNGTGSWSNLNSSILRNNLTINTAGIVTISAGTINYNTGTLTIVTPANVVNNCNLLNCQASTTYNTAGISWQSINLGGAASTHTFQSTFTVTANCTLTHSSSSTITLAGAGFFTAVGGNFTTNATNYTLTLCNNISVAGNLTCNGGNTLTHVWNGFKFIVTGNVTWAGNIGASNWNGTTAVEFAGNSTFSKSTSGNIRIPLIINSTGTVVFDNSNAWVFISSTFTHTAGTLTLTGTTITFNGSYI